jgi:hypothetical protein
MLSNSGNVHLLPCCIRGRGEWQKRIAGPEAYFLLTWLSGIWIENQDPVRYAAAAKIKQIQDGSGNSID